MAAHDGDGDNSKHLTASVIAISSNVGALFHPPSLNQSVFVLLW